MATIFDGLTKVEEKPFSIFGGLTKLEEITPVEQDQGLGYNAIMSGVNNSLSENGSLLQENIISNPLLMRGIREIMKSRYSEDTRNNYTMDERYDNTLNDEDMFEEWQNWNRSLAGGQTVTTANDAAWFVGADDDQRALLGANFEMFEKMPNIFNKDVSWRETLDGIYDYAKAGIWDPSTVAGLGVGRLWTAAGAKSGSFAMRKTAKEIAKAAVKKGLSKDASKQLQKDFLRKSFRKSGVLKKTTIPAMIATDMAIAVGADYGYQNLKIGSNVQDKYSIPQSVGTAISVIVLPSLVAASRGIVSFTKTKIAETVGLEKYIDIFKLHGGKSPKDIERAVLGTIDLSAVDAGLRGVFSRFRDNIDEFIPYMQARDEAAELVTKEKIAGNPSLMEDFFEVTLMFNENGGFAKSMRDAGFIYVPREKNDNVSKFMTDALKYLPDETVKGYKDSFKAQFGKLPESISKIDTAEQLSAWFLNRGRFSGKTLYNRKVLSDFLTKDVKDITAEDMMDIAIQSKKAAVASSADRIKYAQTIWKRLVTSHPSTVGLNVKGWAYTTTMNGVSDAVLAGLYAGTGQGRKAKGTILGAARRGVNLMTPDVTIKAAENYFKIKPDVAEKLFAERAGGVDSAKILEKLNLDPKSKVNQMTEASIEKLQIALGVKLQDETTKMLSFYTALDLNIMKHYGMSHNEFMSQPGAYTKMFSKEFLEKVQEPAIDRANRETYSTSWSQRKGGKFNIWLPMAKIVESISNSAGGGILVPFGRFFNTATATLGDYTGFNALRHITFRAYESKNPLDDEGMLLLAKSMVGVGLIYGKLPNGSSNFEQAKEKIRLGLTWDKTPRTDGSIADETYEFPGGYVELVSQAAAHADLDGTIPPALAEELFKVFVSQSFRDTGSLYDSLKDLIQTYLELDKDKSLQKSIEVLGSSFSRIVSGALRPLEPFNTIASFATGDFEQGDQRQGNIAINKSLRYINKLLGAAGVKSDLPKREKTTRGPDNTFVDVGRTIGGVRSSAPITPSERLFGSIGEKPYQAIRWGGDAEYKNRLDGLVSDLLNYEAAITIEEDNILNQNLSLRTEAANRVREKARKRAVSILSSSLKYEDEIMTLENKISGKKKSHIKDALKLSGYEGNLRELKDQEGAKQKLEFILYLIDNRDDVIFRNLRD